MRKRFSGLLLAGVMAVCLAGCGGDQTSQKQQTTDGASAETNTEAQQETAVTRETLEKQYEAPKEGDTIAAIQVKGYGTIRVRFFPEQAPKAVENFVTHAREGYYDGVTFHRVMNNFMIQGGDPEGTGYGGESIWGGTFENECTDELLVTRGSLCMANAGPDTNGSQFFITQAPAETVSEQSLAQSGTYLGDAAKEVYREQGGAPWLQGQHTVFGQVYDGMDVVDQIAAEESDENGTPGKTITIKKITISQYKE